MADNLKITEQNIDTTIDPNAGIGGILAQDHNDVLKELLKKVGKYTGSPYLSQAESNNGVIPVGVLVWNNNAMNNTDSFEITVAKKTADLNDLGILLETVSGGTIIHFKDYVGRSVYLEYIAHKSGKDAVDGDIYNITVKGKVDNINYTYQSVEKEVCVIEFYNKSSSSKTYIEEGSNIVIDGDGTQSSPYEISAQGSGSIGINDLTDGQSDTFNVMLGSKEQPDSTGETRGTRNTIVGKNTILDGIGDDNVVIGYSSLTGLGSNGNNNSNNNVIIGSKAADDRVNASDNVIIGGNSVQGDGSGSRNIVIGANVDIGGHGINDKMNIGNNVIGELNTSKTGVNGVEPEEDFHSRGSIRQDTEKGLASINLGIAEYYDPTNFKDVTYQLKLPYVHQTSSPYNANGGQSRWDVIVKGSCNGAHTAIDLRFMGFLFSPNGIRNNSETIEHNNPNAGEGVLKVGSFINSTDNRLVLFFTLSGSNLCRFRVDSMIAGTGQILRKGDIEIKQVVPS